MAAALGLALATFVSEDLACVAAGVLIARGNVAPAVALVGCGMGIWIGDIGLWLLGRVGRFAALRSRWLEGKAPPARLQALQRWLNRRGASAIFISRFLPGTRLPTYVAAGAAAVPLVRFAGWSGVAAAVWTPLIVLGSTQFAVLGELWLSPLNTWGAFLGAAAGVGVLALLRVAATAHRRPDVTARIARWRRWEFWPMWLFYPPVAMWIAWLAVRHGGLSTMTAANPGIPDGGTVGESKAAILRALPQTWTVPHLLLDEGDLASRVELLRTGLAQKGWTYPIILKPDVGQRGVGVKLIPDIGGAEEYLARAREPVLVQPYHPGPFEAGIFYYRLPRERSGRIFSITDKHFPVVVGDGTSTLAELIRSHPRYRMQASLFLRRWRDRAAEVIPPGVSVRLAIAGNHAQGTVFRDGAHLITPALERRIDEIAKHYQGFFVGRFDVRYRDVAAFREGRDLAIVELNGATAESTNIYDPGASLLGAYRTLFRQWAIVFAIGAENRRLGVEGTSTRRLARLVADHLRARPAFALSD